MLLLLNLMSGGAVGGPGGPVSRGPLPNLARPTFDGRTAATSGGTSARVPANNPVIANRSPISEGLIAAGKTSISVKASQVEVNVRRLIQSAVDDSRNLPGVRKKLGEIVNGSPLGRMIVTRALYDAEVNLRNTALDEIAKKGELNPLNLVGKNKANQKIDDLNIRARAISDLSVNLALGGLQQAIASNKDATSYSKGLVSVMSQLQSLLAIASQPSAKDQLPQLRDSLRLTRTELQKVRQQFLDGAPDGESKKDLEKAFDDLANMLNTTDKAISEVAKEKSTNPMLVHGASDDIDLPALKESLSNFTAAFAHAVGATVGLDGVNVTGDRLAKIAADEAKSAKTSAFVWTGLAIAATVVALVAVLVAASMVGGAVLSGGGIVALVASLPVTGPLGLAIAGAGAAALLGLYGKAIHSWVNVSQANKEVERYEKEKESLKDMVYGLYVFAASLKAGETLNVAPGEYDDLDSAMDFAITRFDTDSPRAGERTEDTSTVSATSSASSEPTLDAQNRAFNRAARAMVIGNPPNFKDQLSKPKNEILAALRTAFFNADNKEAVVAAFNNLYDDDGNKKSPWNGDDANHIISALQLRYSALNPPLADEDE